MTRNTTVTKDVLVLEDEDGKPGGRLEMRDTGVPLEQPEPENLSAKDELTQIARAYLAADKEEKAEKRVGQSDRSTSAADSRTRRPLPASSQSNSTSQPRRIVASPGSPGFTCSAQVTSV